jgi:hypothetical protein
MVSPEQNENGKFFDLTTTPALRAAPPGTGGELRLLHSAQLEDA